RGIPAGPPKAVHLSVVVLLVHRVPAMRRIRRAEARELEGVMLVTTTGAGLEVTGRRPKALRLHLRRIAEVVIERAVLLTRDHEVLDRRVHLRDAAGARGRRAGGPECSARDRNARCARPPQKRAPGHTTL